jgi:polysaccharide pyruvyl transferase WcaK-like protein
MKHILLYGHGGSYNHGAEAITRCTMHLLRGMSPNCKITLSTHFAEQDKTFALLPDDFVERNLNGKTNADIYAPTIERITKNSICIHVGGDNYCYRNWQRWALIHYAALERNAYSVLWSCSIDPEAIDSEMLVALKTHHLITARERITYNALIERGCTNVIRVRDIAFELTSVPIDLGLENYIVLNVSPLVIRKNSILVDAYQHLIDYILSKTVYNIVLLPHVLQSSDNDYDSLKTIAVNAFESERVNLISDRLSAAQYKYIIGNANFCIAARTHVAIAAYSSGVPTLAIGYSTKAHGIAEDFGASVLDLADITAANILTDRVCKLRVNI